MRLILAATVALALGGAAAAQAPMASSKTTTSTAKTAASSKTKAATPDKPRTAASLQCSKDADAKNIHGKPRKAFMSSCKKVAAKT